MIISIIILTASYYYQSLLSLCNGNLTLINLFDTNFRYYNNNNNNSCSHHNDQTCLSSLCFLQL